MSDTAETDGRVRIDRLLPRPADDLDDDEILATYPTPAGPWVRVNFISSLDGATTRDGRSGGLGDAADRRVFALLRRLADVVLVGAGTIRIEGYGGFRLDPTDFEWRLARGSVEHPVLAIVSGTLDLDPASAVFTDAPVRPIIYTVESAPSHRRTQLEAVADVVSVGATEIDPRALRAHLTTHGLHRIHCEGGPRLFGTLIQAGVVDELCLTLAPTLEAGTAGRIARSPEGNPVGMSLAAVLRAGDELLLRYVRQPA